MPPLFFSSSNLIIQTTVTLSLALIFSFLRIPTLFLQNLHTYIHPDDVNPTNNNSSGGLRAAIRRPGASESDPKPRKKSKQKFEFDENKAQIFRLKLNDAHLQTRLYFKQFSGVFVSTLLAIISMTLQRFLTADKDSGVLANGSLIPILFGTVCIYKVCLLLARVSIERSASKRSEKQLSVLLGVLGFLFGVLVVFDIVPKWVLDFEFESLDSFGKFAVAGFMGSIAGLLYMPAGRNARAFWLGTHQIRSNLSIIACGWVERTLIYANYLMVVFTSLLWINPFMESLVNNNVDGRQGLLLIGDELVGNVGMPRSDFDKFRLWCLLVTGFLQLVTLRANLQIFLNEAVLSWYQRLHASKVPDLEYSRAKVFLHNHYLCLVALQFFAPGALVLLFLGLSQINDNLLKNFGVLCSLLPCTALVKDMALFMAWWVVFVWAIWTSGNLALYRRGILYVS